MTFFGHQTVPISRHFCKLFSMTNRIRNFEKELKIFNNFDLGGFQKLQITIKIKIKNLPYSALLHVNTNVIS